MSKLLKQSSPPAAAGGDVSFLRVAESMCKPYSSEEVEVEVA